MKCETDDVIWMDSEERAEPLVEYSQTIFDNVTTTSKITAMVGGPSFLVLMDVSARALLWFCENRLMFVRFLPALDIGELERLGLTQTGLVYLALRELVKQRLKKLKTF